MWVFLTFSLLFWGEEREDVKKLFNLFVEVREDWMNSEEVVRELEDQ